MCKYRVLQLCKKRLKYYLCATHNLSYNLSNRVASIQMNNALQVISGQALFPRARNYLHCLVPVDPRRFNKVQSFHNNGTKLNL